MSLSIIIPVYNEMQTVKKLINSFSLLNMEKEIIIVDDGSDDGTGDYLKTYRSDFTIVALPRNKGKGYCIRQGLKHCTKKYTVVKDADLEQSIEEINKLYKAQQANPEKMILGTRVLSWQDYDIRFVANLFFSCLISYKIKLNITDVMSGYKMMKTEFFQNLKLQSNRFGIEPEIIRQAVKNQMNIIEIPVDYFPRTKKEGKKIRFFDSFSVIKEIWKP